MEVPVSAKIDQLISKFNALDKRQKINLGVIAFVGVMVIIAFFFVKSSFGKIQVDRSVIDEIKKERAALVAERKSLQDERAQIKTLIGNEQAKDSAAISEISRQTAYLLSINSKLQTLNNAYKKPAQYNNLSSDSLARFFSNLDK